MWLQICAFFRDIHAVCNFVCYKCGCGIIKQQERIIETISASVRKEKTVHRQGTQALNVVNYEMWMLLLSNKCSLVRINTTRDKKRVAFSSHFLRRLWTSLSPCQHSSSMFSWTLMMVISLKCSVLFCFVSGNTLMGFSLWLLFIQLEENVLHLGDPWKHMFLFTMNFCCCFWMQIMVWNFIVTSQLGALWHVQEAAINLAFLCWSNMYFHAL